MTVNVIEELLKRRFVDYMNPTERELEKWMKDPNVFEPTQDWDLVVGCDSNIHSLARLVCQEAPEREFMVHCLHVSTAEAFNRARETILEAVEIARECPFEDVQEWRRNAVNLVENPKSYNEDDWYDYLNR